MVVVEVVGGGDLGSGTPAAIPLRVHPKLDALPMTHHDTMVPWCQGSPEFRHLNYKALAISAAS